MRLPATRTRKKKSSRKPKTQITWAGLQKQAYSAGLTPDGYYDATLGEVLLFVAASRDKENREWQRARFVAYTQYCGTVESKSRVSIFEFLPLPGDPTPAQLEKMKAKEQNAFAASIARRSAAAMEKYKKLGLLKLDE